MPNISVIVPVYKVEAFLHRCVDSILAQTYRDFELILVDDGSPDNCGAICDGYAEKDCRIHVIHQHNGGLSAARNTGIDYVFESSNSQWLAFVDSDDWLHPEYLQQLYRAVEQTGCQISACGFYYTDGSAIPDEEPLAAESVDADDYYCGGEFGNATPAACGKLYHRDLFYKLRYPVGKLHEDEFTTYRALYRAGKIAVVRGKLYAYFQNPEGITHSVWTPRRMDVLEAFEAQIAFAQQKCRSRLLKKTVEAYIYGICNQLEKAQKVFHKELRKKLRRGLKLARELNCGMGYSRFHWAYEMAYPCKAFWWLISKVRKT